jgi:gluconolactonase
MTGEREIVVSHRRGIGGVALHSDGGVVVAGRNLAWKRGTESVVLADVDLDGPYARFNDLCVALDGAVYAGSIDLAPAGSHQPAFGSLIRVGIEGFSGVVASGLAQSNGLVFAEGGRRLFHVDTGPRILRVYDVHDDGSLGPWSVFHQWSVGTPDGVAAASDGTLWVAVANVDGTGFIDVLEPDGAVQARLAMPDPRVRSLCFGGDDLMQLYVTLGGDSQATSMDGEVIEMASWVAGAPVPAATAGRPAG